MPGAKKLIPTPRGIKPAVTVCHPDLVEGSVPPAFAVRSEWPGPPPDFSADFPRAAAQPGTETSPDIDVEEKLKDAFARGWSVIVWNDPVNLMDYVVYVFKTVLKMNEKDASRHMWEVHQLGKSVVARETREKSELLVHRLRGFGLNATLEKA
jgi:ATP-dependent Clp protease adaptor protein ClpS